MCRNIRTLANFAPPATAEEIRASSLQFVRKVSGANKPSKANEALFYRTVDEVTAAAGRLIHGWVTRIATSRSESTSRSRGSVSARIPSEPRSIRFGSL